MEQSELLVADSFRVREHAGQAEVRAYGLHCKRFTQNVLNSVQDLHLPDNRLAQQRLSTFISQLPKRIASYGAGFPRIEFRMAGSELLFNLRHRPLPQLTNELQMRTCVPSKQVRPATKGPNIEYYRSLNAQLGVEALFCSPTGSVVEGATTTLLWWNGETLHHVSSHAEDGTKLARVQSITESLVLDIADQLHFKTSAQDIPASELASSEVWAVNALHGIRRVSRIDGIELSTPNITRLRQFHSALDTYWKPISASSENR